MSFVSLSIPKTQQKKVYTPANLVMLVIIGKKIKNPEFNKPFEDSMLNKQKIEIQFVEKFCKIFTE